MYHLRGIELVLIVEFLKLQLVLQVTIHTRRYSINAELEISFFRKQYELTYFTENLVLVCLNLIKNYLSNV